MTSYRSIGHVTYSYGARVFVRSYVLICMCKRVCVNECVCVCVCVSVCV